MIRIEKYEKNKILRDVFLHFIESEFHAPFRR